MSNYTLNLLHNFDILGKIARLLRLRILIDQVLVTIPWVKKTSTGIKYRLERADAVFLAEAIFWSDYLETLERHHITFNTFADIGSNRGFFTLYLMHLARVRGDAQPRGICIDANPVMKMVARENFERNNINIIPHFGAVGVEAEEGTTDTAFYINQADMSSSVFITGEKVSVPVLSMKKIWSDEMGHEVCDLLKIDIEGSEAKLLDYEKDFIKNVRFAIIEYHEPMSTRKDIETKMADMGFECLECRSGLIWPELRGELYFKKK